MTTQSPEKLINECAAVDFGNLKIYGVLTGDVTDTQKHTRYEFTSKGNPKKFTMCTALWRGYVSTYRITRDGELVLERIEYPFTKNAEPDSVCEKAVGDFWLDMREGFLKRKIYVPFVLGKLLTNRDKWVTFEKT